MKKSGNPARFPRFLLLILAGIGAILVGLSFLDYFPEVSMTLLIAAAVFLLPLTLDLPRPPVRGGRSAPPRSCFSDVLCLRALLGALSSAGCGTLALCCYLNAGGRSAYVLAYFSAMFLALELISLILYRRNRSG